MVARPGTHLLRHQAIRWIGILGMALAMSGCSAPLGDYHDEELSLTQDDYSNVIGSTNTNIVEQYEAEAPPIPDLVPALVAPVPQSGAENRLVSISVTDSVSLRDVLLELARAAEIDVEIDPTIEGGVIFTANNKPFIEVIERIANMANLRYSFKNGVLQIELDRPYHRNYRIDQIAASRISQASMDVSTDIFSSVGESGGGNNGSTANITQDSDTDFYQELEVTIWQILSNSEPQFEVDEIQLASVD